MSDEVRRMFARITRRYDLGNDVLSFGAHRIWKRDLVLQSTPGSGGAVIDLATGTGDIAARFADSVGTEGTVVGIDFCDDMIDYARVRPGNQKKQLRFEVGDAMSLPFDDDTFDTASISFGIRNVDDPVRALREMRRVVRPGGKVVVLETGQPTGLWGLLYRIYSSTLLPLVGGIVSGSFSAYSYLHRTSMAFACGERFVEMMMHAGLDDAHAQPLFGGIAYLYSSVVRKAEHQSAAALNAVGAEE